MDIVIQTSDPEAINAAEIQMAIENLGYRVASIIVIERAV